MDQLQQVLNILLDIEVKGENVLKLARAMQLLDNSITELKKGNEEKVEG